jgi:predicted membrane channel-forming protein YqfA (hemolysin III family)
MPEITPSKPTVWQRAWQQALTAGKSLRLSFAAACIAGVYSAVVPKAENPERVGVFGVAIIGLYVARLAWNKASSSRRASSWRDPNTL